jgi:hypothetical protein
MTGRLAALAPAALIVASCTTTGQEGAAAPGFTIGREPLAYADSVAAYAERIGFNEYAGAGDVQLLHHDPCPPCTHGPTVALQPQRGSHRYTRAELAQGRVIARLVNRDSTGYDRYALAPRAVVYWWVDSTAAGWRSIFVRTVPDRAAVVSDLDLRDDHPAGTWGHASAAWLWGSAEIAWATCGDRGCCQSGGERVAER